MMHKPKPSVEELEGSLYYATMCSIQHRGYPCNSCFHTIIEADYGHLLKEDTHEYWRAVLSFRGDYDDLPKRLDLIEELYNVIEGEYYRKEYLGMEEFEDE
tara:strand:+ start:9487 stop:9789 length:303 start_codon:yes stop_codon:yes gene_type:complete